MAAQLGLETGRVDEATTTVGSETSDVERTIGTDDEGTRRGDGTVEDGRKVILMLRLLKNTRSRSRSVGGHILL